MTIKIKEFDAFRESCRHVEPTVLVTILDDIKKRIGDAVLSGDDHYLEQQKRKALIVQLEMKRRLGDR